MNGSEAAAAAFELALEAEKLSLDSYLGWALVSRNQAAKNVFVRLARDEFGHMRLIEAHLKKLAQPTAGIGAEFEFADIGELVPRQPGSGLHAGGEADQQERNALQSALESELRAEKFYARHAEQDGQATLVFRRLAQAERNHAALIQAEIDHIDKTGYWFDFPEFTLEGA